MNIVGRKVTHNHHPRLGTGVVQALNGATCIVRWQYETKQFAGLSSHPRSVLSFVPKNAKHPTLTNDPLTW
jgi:hypothetical protein